jgi:hypothetical protein
MSLVKGSLMSKKILLLALALYIASTAISFGVFSVIGKPGSVPLTPDGDVADNGDGETSLGQLLQISPQEPKDQACPLNGQLYTNTEKTAWEQRRPLAVMIENTPDARPQSGMSQADVVFEAVAEYGITRFMGLFYCDVQVADTTLAPIRSARTYFVDWASGFNAPMYVHVGGANTPGPADALGQISDYGWNGQNDINQFSVGYPTFVRDYNRIPGKDIQTEHTMVTSTEKLWAIAAKRGWTNMSPKRTLGRTTTGGTDWKANYQGWSFVDGQANQGSVTSISYSFMGDSPTYAVQWNYDAATNSYKRNHGGELHTDLNDSQPVIAKNVVVLLTTEKGPIDELKHMLYTTTGTGEALVFNNGQVTQATWSKKDRTSELLLSDSKGKPLSLVRGQVWISVLSKTAEVAY